MTETRNHLPKDQPEQVRVAFDEHQQPRLFFDKLCRQEVRIERSTDGGDWQKIAEGVRSPYTDESDLEDAAHIRYRILVGDPQQQSYELSVRLPG